MLRYGATIFLGAFLVFQVQPIVAKYILPWFGGTPSVWTTCMLFFQALLLLGYAWAHGVASRLRPRAQVGVHLGLVVVALGALATQALLGGCPLLPPESLEPDGAEAPVPLILALLALSTGLPYLVLAANSPLMQVWFHLGEPGRSPYRLFVLSNLGSGLALVSYPFLVEPLLSLSAQAWVWATLFLAFGLGAAVCGLRVLRAQPVGPSPLLHPLTVPAGTEEPPRPGLARHLLWVGMTACASAMLVASTNQICQEVAVIPFLWILPLSLYLLSFILTFDSERWYSRRVFTVFLALATAGALWVLFDGPTAGVALQILAFSGALFAVCMVCHGELVRLKPHPRHLTSFYLMVSVGGAAGGLFVGLLAPLLFVGYWELHLCLFLVWVLLWLLSLAEPGSWLRRGRLARLRRLGALAGVLCLGAVLLAHTLWYQRKAVWTSRGFYGLLWIEHEVQVEPPDIRLHRLDIVHGQIRHGSQFQEEAYRRLPVAYFSRGSGAGLALLHHPGRYRPWTGGTLKVGIIGLGAGVLAAYGQPGDLFRFYEISPTVAEVAQGLGGYFDYLAASQARVEVILGDARLQMEAELARGEPQQYDLFMVDAFSSDAIPMHLLTREAFQLYLHHLKPDGVLAFHVSNDHLNLVLVVARLAQEFLLPAALVVYVSRDATSLDSDWVLVSANEEFLQLPELHEELSLPNPLRTEFPVSLWTDDFSNLAEVLE